MQSGNLTPLDSLHIFLRPFSPSTWIYFLIVAFLLLLCSIVIHYFECKWSEKLLGVTVWFFLFLQLMYSSCIKADLLSTFSQPSFIKNIDDLVEQIKAGKAKLVVEILDIRYDKILHSENHNYRKLKEAIQSNPKGWEVVGVEQMCETMKKQGFPKPVLLHSYHSLAGKYLDKKNSKCFLQYGKIIMADLPTSSTGFMISRHADDKLVDEINKNAIGILAMNLMESDKNKISVKMQEKQKKIIESIRPTMLEANILLPTLGIVLAGLFWSFMLFLIETYIFIRCR